MKKEKTLINIFLLFFTLSIFLDLHIFYNSISTLIRALFISIFCLFLLIKKGTFKERKNIFIYGFIVLVYLLFHHLNAMQFHSYVPSNFNYNLLDECLYIFKMLSNVFIFYIVYKLNIRFKDIQKYLKIIIFFITFSIIISDLLSLSYTAYNFELTKIPMFKWFTLKEYDFIYGSSKGFFHMTNQLVAILLMYLPIILSETFMEKKKISNYLLSFMIIISMVMIGNRLAIYGTILELFLTLVLYFLITKNKKNNIGYFLFNVLLILSVFIIIPFSPLNKRNDYYEAIYNDKSLDFMEYKNDVYDEYNEDEALEERFKEKQIDPQFIFKSYPYKYDPEFWEDILQNDEEVTGNARYIELAMVKRVKEVNDNFKDNFFGLTYSRIMNIFNIEQDFIMQFYSIGILGMIIFLGLYIYLFIYIIIKILFDLKRKFNYLNIALFMGTGILFVSAYFSGNLLNSISIIIPFTFILSVLYNEVREKNKKEEKESILGFNVCTLKEEDLIKKAFNNKKQLFIVNVNPLIALNYYHDKEKKKLFNQEEIAIPDGEGVVLVSKLKGGNINKRIAGIDFMLAICKKASELNKTIYLYGAKPNVALKVKEKLENIYPNIKIVGYISGYEQEDIVIKDIKKKKPDILFVALGSPLQEEFILKNKENLKSVQIFMPVGGSFDVISGNLKRAPKIIQTLKLEWLYRMIKEPKRFKGIFKLIEFMILNIFDYQDK